jgi:hypothetical protein
MKLVIPTVDGACLAVTVFEPAVEHGRQLVVVFPALGAAARAWS